MKLLQPQRTWTPRQLRSGMTLLEATVAITLLVGVMAAVVPVLSRTSMIRDQVDRRAIALDAVANVLERATREPELNEQKLQDLSAGRIPENRLALPEWKFTVHSEPPLRRVEATLSWQHRDQIRSSVSLVRWYPGGER